MNGPMLCAHALEKLKICFAAGFVAAGLFPVSES